MLISIQEQQEVLALVKLHIVILEPNNSEYLITTLKLPERVWALATGKIGSTLRRIESRSYTPCLTFNQTCMTLMLAIGVARRLRKLSTAGKLAGVLTDKCIKKGDLAAIEALYAETLIHKESFVLLAVPIRNVMDRAIKVKEKEDFLLVRNLRKIINQYADKYNEYLRDVKAQKRHVRKIEACSNILRLLRWAKVQLREMVLATMAAGSVMVLYWILKEVFYAI